MAFTGGPPVRGTKLEAWRIPPVWKSLQENVLTVPAGSTLTQNQEKLIKTTIEVLEAVAKDVRQGLLETVGVESSLSLDEECCSMVLHLPKNVADTEKIAQAIDSENIEAWRDEKDRVHIAVSPWFSTKDVDQTVLSAVKVIHVMLGIHASDGEESKPKTLKQKLLSSVLEVMQIQKNVGQK